MREPTVYDRLFTAYQELQGKYDALVKEVIAMKRDGFVPSVPLDAPKPIPDLPAPITETLRDLALEPMTERHLRKQAWERLRQGMEPIDVAKLIEAGETVDL